MARLDPKIGLSTNAVTYGLMPRLMRVASFACTRRSARARKVNDMAIA